LTGYRVRNKPVLESLVLAPLFAFVITVATMVIVTGVTIAVPIIPVIVAVPSGCRLCKCSHRTN